VRLRLCLAAALLLRVAAACAHAVQGPVVQPDEANYLLVAHALVEEHRYATHPGGPPEIIRGPAYAVFLAPFVRFGAAPVLGPALAQAALGTLTVWIVAAALRRRLLREGLAAAEAERAGVLAGWACAVSPIAIGWERLVMSEALATLLLAAALAVWWDAPRRRRPWLAACAAGACLGALVLAKPAFLLLPLALALPALLRRDRARIGQAAVVAATAAALVLPWTLRNLEVTGRPIPVGLGSGLFLFAATVPRAADGVPSFDDPADRAAVARYLNHDTPVADRVAADDAFRGRAIVRIREHPFAYAAAAVPRAARLWVSSHSDALSRHPPARAVRLAAAALFGAVVLAALSVLLLPKGPWRTTGLAFLGAPAYTTLVHAWLASGSRYAVVAWPFVWGAMALAVSARLRARAAA
jgi:4-amino-4-deoxy-L-arabinose transferase-like glycosyltransferase